MAFFLGVADLWNCIVCLLYPHTLFLSATNISSRRLQDGCWVDWPAHRVYGEHHLDDYTEGTLLNPYPPPILSYVLYSRGLGSVSRDWERTPGKA